MCDISLILQVSKWPYSANIDHPSLSIWQIDEVLFIELTGSLYLAKESIKNLVYRVKPIGRQVINFRASTSKSLPKRALRYKYLSLSFCYFARFFLTNVPPSNAIHVEQSQ